MGRESVTTEEIRMTSFNTIILLVVASFIGISFASTCTSYPKEHTMTKYKGPSRICAKKTEFRGFTDAGKNLIVKTHNELREKVAGGLESNGAQPGASNMRKLVWNDELAEVAQRLVDQCKFAHDKNRNTCDGTYVGQNIYMGYAWKQSEDEVMATVDKAVNNWYSEVEKPGFDSSFISPFQYAPGAGHYTQVVWAETQAVGCGLVNYEEGGWYKTLIACNYGVGGNMMGGTMYKVGKGCSDCPAGTSCDQTFDNLCA